MLVKVLNLHLIFKLIIFFLAFQSTAKFGNKIKKVLNCFQTHDQAFVVQK